MHITHYNSFAKGGAATSALRLMEALQKERIQVVVQSYSNFSEINTVLHKPTHTLGKRVFNKLVNAPWNAKVHGKDYEIVSKSWGNLRLLPDSSTDVTHLHWVANFFDWKTFFANLTTPLVWTLHDMNPFQGIFHYLNDRERNQSLAALDEREAQRKYSSFKKFTGEAVICTPSRWLLEASKESKIFGHLPHQHIPYGIPLDRFRPVNSESLRSYFDISDDEPTLLFVAESLTNKRKGMEYVEKLLPKIEEQGVRLVAVGKKDPRLPKNVVQLGYVEEALMPLVYNMSDGVIVPSLEDNLPNTMLEALACGKPVIAFNVGGMREHIDNGKTGFLAESISEGALEKAIEMWRENYQYADAQKTSTFVRHYAEVNFCPTKQASAYIDLYKTLSKVK